MSAADASEATAWERLRHIAMISYRDCDEAVAIIAFLQAGNTEAAEAAFSESGHIPNLVRKAMLQRLVMTLMRLFDKPGTDRETLVRAFALLSQSAIYGYACTQGAKAHLDAAIANWETVKDRKPLPKLRAIRDFEFAHSIPSKITAEKPTYHELFSIAELTFETVERLALGTGILEVRLSAAQEIWHARANEYWKRLT